MTQKAPKLLNYIKEQSYNSPKNKPESVEAQNDNKFKFDHQSYEKYLLGKIKLNKEKRAKENLDNETGSFD